MTGTSNNCPTETAVPPQCGVVPKLVNTTIIKKYGKRDRTFNIKCCPFKPAVPPEYCCFWPQIFDQFETLLRRQYCMQTKNPVVHEMALPKHVRSKYVSPCYCLRKCVEIRRLYERQPTRTQQLALPRVRDFLNLKGSKYFNTFPQLRKDAILRNMRRSFYSLYAYLSNNRLYCMKKAKREKPSKKKFGKMMARLDELAAPKEVPKPPPREPSDGESDPERLSKLAMPREYPPGPESEAWCLTRGLRTFVPSAKLKELARPKEYYPDNNNPDFNKVNPKALKYKATEKIKEMSQPVVRNREDGNIKENAFSISPNALKAVASARVKELAEPKDYEDTHNKPGAYSVSPKALKAVASPRIIELAKPKQYAF